MNLSGVDLNLLVSLDALLEERSVTRAARRVGLSPSAMSHSLARLRHLFGDRLLVRSPGGMLPTPGAEALHQHVRRALEHVRLALEILPAFDPASSSRVFRLSASDGIQTTILPELLRRLSESAPGITLIASDPMPSRETALALSNDDLDLAIDQFADLPPGLHRERLFEARIVVLVRSGHPRIKSRLSLQQFLDEGHIAIRPTMPQSFDLDDALDEQGLQRRIVATVRSVDVAPLVVAKTDFICSTAEHVVRGFIHELNLRAFDHPASPPRPEFSLAWSTRLHESPAHQWFRALVQDCVEGPSVRGFPIHPVRGDTLSARASHSAPADAG